MIQLDLSCRQERDAQRCVDIVRFVYDRLVTNEQAGAPTGRWPTSHELEKVCNAAKSGSPTLAFVTKVSKLVAPVACSTYLNARSRWPNTEVKGGQPVFLRKNRTGAGSFLAGAGLATKRLPGTVTNPRGYAKIPRTLGMGTLNVAGKVRAGLQFRGFWPAPESGTGISNLLAGPATRPRGTEPASWRPARVSHQQVLLFANREQALLR